ncbi:hypothetical protein P5673_002061 [Acropora cervicornis]|uniref:Uncharacterized protein n=1 Tax=Acropora cervicornis TaxID=6130 RepID=A0AAD9VFY4_ACRCE|nr:hypothetical protein P5673_002061 [Acropora cervicornis]
MAILQNLSCSKTTTISKNDRTPDDFQPRAQIKRKFKAGELKCGDSEAIKKFSNEYIVPEKLVTDYVDHLAQVAIQKEKRKAKLTDSGQRQRQEYNDIDWDNL